MQNLLSFMNELPPITSVLAFIEVATRGAFNEAARALELSPSATSKAVTRLEDHLGVKLLRRTTRSVSLTPEGVRYLEGARQIVQDLRELDAELSASTSEPRGKLSVNAPAALARMWLVDTLPTFHSRYPRVNVELILDDRTVDLAGEGVDVVIRSGELADSVSLVAKKLYDETLYTCAAPDYWARHGRPAHPEDLKHHNCLNFRVAQTGRQFPWAFTVDGMVAQIDVEGSLTVNEGESVARAAMAGLGVAQLPGYMARAALQDGRLEEALEEFRPPSTPITALYLDRRLVSPKVRAFIDFLAETASELG